MTAHLVVVAGPPGAGKSTVARLVAAQLDPSVCLESDWLWTTVVNGFIPPWEPESFAQNRTIVRAAGSLAVQLAAGGYHVVLDGVFSVWSLDVLAAELAAAPVPCSYVVLRPDLETCLARATGRAGEAPRIAANPPLTDEGPVRDMWHQFADLGELDHHAIDTSTLDPTATAAAVLDAVRAGSHHLDRPPARP